jgi:hypothetical protein
MNTAARRQTGAQTLTAKSVAERMYDEARGDLKRAEDMIVNYISSMSGTTPAFAVEFIRRGARSMLNEIGQTARYRIEAAQHTKIPHTINEGTRAAIRRAQRLGQIVTETLFDMPYKWNGVDVKLGDLTGEQVIEIGNQQLARGSTMVREGRWLIRAGALAGDKVMRAALTADELAKIKAEAEGMSV